MRCGQRQRQDTLLYLQLTLVGQAHAQQRLSLLLQRDESIKKPALNPTGTITSIASNVNGTQPYRLITLPRATADDMFDPDQSHIVSFFPPS